MVRDRQLPTPMIDHSLSQASMELAVLQNDLVDSAWRRASPKMESLRFVALPISEHDRIRYIQRGFMVPGGRYFLIFVYDRVYIVSLQEPSGTPVSFINLRDVNMEGLDITTSNWKAERHDDGSLTLFVSIRPANRWVEEGRVTASCNLSNEVLPNAAMLIPQHTRSGQLTFTSLPLLKHIMASSQSGDHRVTRAPKTSCSCSVQMMAVTSPF